ncbi:MAG TPA: hypothetical protein VK633_02990, partial [Verrucomicrobiae bacterium]|nr:hypothetical protein [Verrucomicrobiae bacterium]
LAVNTKEVQDGKELVSVLRDYRDGQTVHLRVRRVEEEFDIDVVMMLPQFDHASDREERINRSGVGISERAEGFEMAIQHDTVLQPWLCGGPLMNLEGKAIGMNIARAGRVASYALPAQLSQQIAAKLIAEAKTKDPEKSLPGGQTIEVR